MSRKSRKNVGLIGLGIIGSRVAAGLRASGFHVFVWNRTAKPAPNFLGSPAEIAQICDVIQLFVSDSQAVLEMIDALGEALTSRHIVVCCATIGPEATIEAARLVEQKGARFLDAPFTGSLGAAERSQLVYYVGGDEAVYLRAKPVLDATSKAIVRCGKIGDAATLKVVTNLISAVQTQTLAEALAITRMSGIPAEALSAALEQNACRSGTIELKLPKMVSADYAPHFSLKHMFKDVQLGIHLANSLDLEVPATTVTAGVMYGALNNGWADLDFSSVYRIYEASLARLDPPALAAPAAAALQDKEPEALTGRAVEENSTPPAELSTAAASSSVPSDAAGASEAAKTEATGDAVATANPLESSSAPAVPAEAGSAGEALPSKNEIEAGASATESIKTDAEREPGNGNAAEAKKPADSTAPERGSEVPGSNKPDTVAENTSAGPLTGIVTAETKPDEPPKAAEENGGSDATRRRPFNRLIRRIFTPAAK